MPAPRKLTDDRLLDTAARLFAERGYDATSISNLVAELGVTRMTLYARARSKEKLAAAVYDRAIRWYRAELPRYVRPGDPPLARLRGLVRLQLEAVERLRHSMAFVIREFGGLSPRPEWRAWWLELDGQLDEIVAAGRTNGELLRDVDPTVLRRTFWSIVSDLPRWYRPGRLSSDEVAHQIVALFAARARPGFPSRDRRTSTRRDRRRTARSPAGSA